MQVASALDRMGSCPGLAQGREEQRGQDRDDGDDDQKFDEGEAYVALAAREKPARA